MTSIDAIINRQLLRWELEHRPKDAEPALRQAPLPIVTISRQSGSRGSYFGSRLAQRLGYQRLHREVIDAICTSSDYRKRVVESLDDKLRGRLELTVESMITGESFDSGDYLRHLYRIIQSMAHLGGVIVMGRGASFILGPTVGFHIRVVAPKDRRIDNLVRYSSMAPGDAERRISLSDKERKEFIARLFKADIDEPAHYDLVFNSCMMDVEEMVTTAEVAFHAKMNKLSHRDHE